MAAKNNHGTNNARNDGAHVWLYSLDGSAFLELKVGCSRSGNVASKQYDKLFANPRWDVALSNLVIFGILFIAFSLLDFCWQFS